MSIILGVDPGSRISGFGVIQRINNKFYYISSGCIRTGLGDLSTRLKKIHEGISQIINRHKPLHVAIEKVFMAKNPDSALKLGHARGAAIVAAVQYDLAVYEYSARQIKQAVVGKGSADKQQIQHMVTVLLKLNRSPQVDAADALATALCHGYNFESQCKLKTYTGMK